MKEQKTKSRRDPFLHTLGFVARQWRRQPGLAASIAIGSLVIAGTELLLPTLAGRLVDIIGAVIADRDAALRDALLVLAVMVGAGALVVALRQGVFILIIDFTLRMMSAVARDTFARVQRLSTEWHANAFAGSTVRKISRGMWAFDNLNDTVMVALWPSLVVLLGAALLFALHWPLMGLAVALGSAVYIGLTVWLALRYVTPAAQLSNAWDSRLGGALADAVSANPVVKSFGAETREDERLGRIVDRWRSRARVLWLRATWAGTLQNIVLVLLRLTVIGLVLLFWWQGIATIGEVVFVLTAYGVIHGYLRDIGYHIDVFRRCVNDLDELVELHDAPVGVVDHRGARDILVPKGEIVFDDVVFGYRAQGRQVYDGLTVRIPAGQRVGLVGASGSGKTTFVKLVQRLHDIDGGRIAIDGQDISEVTQDSLRRQVAIVQQEPMLFHRSLAENIAYGKPEASRERIRTAARLAHADGFIMRQPKGYATLVGERGVKLSGGERQRVALARAFLADTPILILDEATSSLDSESEALIQDAMERLMRGRTTLVIAHRLSTVRTLDRILVFDEGRIVEDGSHAALMQRKDGIYRRLVQRQAEGVADGLFAA
ncbi:MAG: ABC transporter ATP-binding protein [Alphaproteobacteria bacterium]|nr:ABC transporter ATP-binding protein [Alphaproteobacteria bacterium]MCW5741923.1 ABC transporter ATP-binding protein [Alphaproteobacteria bacterium]